MAAEDTIRFETDKPIILAKGEVNLTYHNSKSLRATVTVDPKYAGHSVIVSNLRVNGTPYTQTNNIVASNVGSDGSIIIEAIGQYVSGHLLHVIYLIVI